MGTAQYAAGYTASDDASANGVFTANDRAKQASCHGAANSATNNLLSTSPVVCHIFGIGPAIALAGRIGLVAKVPDDRTATRAVAIILLRVMISYSFFWTQEPPPALGGI